MFTIILRILPCVFIFCVVANAVAAPEPKKVQGVDYYILRASPSSVKVIWRDKAGKQLRTFPEVARFVSEDGTRIDTIMNGGIFEPKGIPSGLLIQDSKVLRPVNRQNGKGNFFLKPNGIFLVGSGGARVITTNEYSVSAMNVDYAVQSGPLLLRQGKIHPKFNVNSTSRLHRNGVGVTTTGEVVFIMTNIKSKKFPNLYEFAELFKTLGCPDALFLDGDLSVMKSGDELTKPSSYFGSFIVVEKDLKN